LVTQPEALQSAQPLLSRKPEAVYLVSTMELSRIERELDALPQAEMVVGLGGGMALDFAKFICWKRGGEPVLVPGAASVDAAVCLAIAVRERSRVRYVGEVLARQIICDFELMLAAPLRLNRAGIGDILSIHTALYDWRLAAERGKAKFAPDIAAAAYGLLEKLEQNASEIHQVSERGLRFLMEAFAEENALCIDAGSSRPEEGSEHFFAYAVEQATGRAFVHGELVCLGVVLMSRLQGNQPERALRLIENVGVSFQPVQLGLSRRQLEEVLLHLRRFSEEENLVWSVVNEAQITPAVIEKLLAGLVFA